MSKLTEAQLEYLRGEFRLARIATVGADGMPHVTPVGWFYNEADEVFEISGHNFAATKKFRDVASTARAAIVIDDVVPPSPPFQIRGVEIRGRAQAVDGPRAMIRLQPDHVRSWGL